MRDIGTMSYYSDQGLLIEKCYLNVDFEYELGAMAFFLGAYPFLVETSNSLINSLPPSVVM